jgi:ribulose 1,5-bisphosphate carboxylase large subunit-like protein
MWRIQGEGLQKGGLVVGTITKNELCLQPKPLGEACYAFWQGGDFINQCIPEDVKAMRATNRETGSGKLFSANTIGDAEYGKTYNFYMPPAFLRLHEGPAVNVGNTWRTLGKGMQNGGLVVGTIIKPQLDLQPKPFGEACYAFWPFRDAIKNDEPQGHQVFCQLNECIPEVGKAMRAAIRKTGNGKLFSTNISADDCGQGLSDHPDLAKRLMDQGFDSMSLNPDSVILTWQFLTK